MARILKLWRLLWSLCHQNYYTLKFYCSYGYFNLINIKPKNNLYMRMWLILLHISVADEWSMYQTTYNYRVAIQLWKKNTSIWRQRKARSKKFSGTQVIFIYCSGHFSAIQFHLQVWSHKQWTRNMQNRKCLIQPPRKWRW